MARILYGVSGEGSGHAIRSREVVRHLRSRGHEVQIVTYGRALQLLRSEFQCHEVFGLHIDYRQNSARYLPTIWKNAIKAPQALSSLRAVGAIVRSWKPDLIITDLEPFTVLQGIRHTVPLLTIDNNHHVSYRRRATPWRYRHERLIARSITRLIVPYADYRIITSFDGTIRPHRRATGVYPIVRPEIYDLKVEQGNHFLLYDSFGNEKLLARLVSIPYEFRVYGHNREAQTGNITLRKFSEETFVEDLRGAKAVIGTAGFTLISESLVLKKPYLAIPVSGQFEQIDNALELEALGYGMMAKELTGATLATFVHHLPAIQHRLEAYAHPGSEAIFGTIDEVISKLVS